MSGQPTNRRRSMHRSATKPVSYSVLKMAPSSDYGRTQFASRMKNAKYDAAPQDVESLLAIIDSQRRALSHRAQIITDLQRDVDILGQKLLEEREKAAHFLLLHTQSEKEVKILREKAAEGKEKTKVEGLSRWNTECVFKMRESDDKIKLKEVHSVKHQKSVSKAECRLTPRDSEETREFVSESLIPRKIDHSSEIISTLRAENEKLKSELTLRESQLAQKDKTIAELSHDLSTCNHQSSSLASKHNSLEKSYSELLLSVKLFRKRQGPGTNSDFNA